MAYLCGTSEFGSMGALGLSLPSLPKPPSPAAVAASLTPAGVMWAAPPSVQAAANQLATNQAAQQQAVATSQQATTDVINAQNMLIYLSLFPGPVSGILDPNTMDALNKFRASMNLPQGGQVSQQDLMALQMAAQMKSQQTPGGTMVQTQPGVMTPSYMPSMLPGGSLVPEGLPSWALPVGAAAGALLLYKLFVK